jgi:hypothetical protein
MIRLLCSARARKSLLGGLFVPASCSVLHCTLNEEGLSHTSQTVLFATSKTLSIGHGISKDEVKISLETS